VHALRAGALDEAVEVIEAAWPEAAGAALEQVAHLAAGLLPDGFDSIEARLATLRGALPWGDVGGAIENAHRAAELEEPDAAAIAGARATVDSCPDPGIRAEQLVALERQPRARTGPRGADLTEREVVVLRMLTGPLSERDIGRELYVSQNTIHSHTRSIYRKLGVSSRSEAVTRGRRLSLI